jgi:hypothetical protein
MNVYILTVDAYDDFGAHLGSNIVGIYTTPGLAQKQMDSLPTESISLEYQYSIEERILEGE